MLKNSLLKIRIILTLGLVLVLHSSKNFEHVNNIQFGKAHNTSELKAISDLDRQPLYFVQNNGQVDEDVLFYSINHNYNLWLTEDGIKFEWLFRKVRDGIHNFRAMNLDSISLNNAAGRKSSTLLFIDAKETVNMEAEKVTGYKYNFFVGNDETKWKRNVPTAYSVVYREVYENIDLRIYSKEKHIEYDWIVKPGGDVQAIQFGFTDASRVKLKKTGDIVAGKNIGKIIHSQPMSYQIINGETVQIKSKFKRINESVYGIETADYDKNIELVIDPVLSFSTYLGGAGNDYARGVAVDKDGSVYVTGWTSSANLPLKDAYQNSNNADRNVFITKFSKWGNSLVYSTYLGGHGSCEGYDIAVDDEGAAYVTGYAVSGFPLKNPYQSSWRGHEDGFVTKLSPDGSDLEYSTYLGGSGREWSKGIAVDNNGSAYVSGWTYSTDFPTYNAYQVNLRGERDAFVTKLTPAGNALAYSTYLGGNNWDTGGPITVDKSGNAYVAGGTYSSDFPLVNAYQSYNGSYDSFITKFSQSGSHLVYSTCLGGSDQDSALGIAVDDAGSAYITGPTKSTDFPLLNPYQNINNGGAFDVFITKLSPDGNSLEYSTYLGGADQDRPEDIAVDNQKAAYVVGRTWSTDYPIRSPFQDFYKGGPEVFLTKINPSGNDLIYSTYLGGSNWDAGYAVALDSEGGAYLAGDTVSFDFPLNNPFQDAYQGGTQDVFVSKFTQTKQYSLHVFASSGGTTDPVPGSYFCNEGSEVIVTAIPDAHYKLDEWTGDVSSENKSENPIAVFMDSDKSITANFIRIIYPPLNPNGQKILNRSLSQAEYINEITWQTNPGNVDIVKYRIYLVEGTVGAYEQKRRFRGKSIQVKTIESNSNGGLNNQLLLVELGSDTFKYWHRNVEKDRHYRYCIVAVNNFGVEGDPAYVDIE